jgi:hypothetical protein
MPPKRSATKRARAATSSQAEGDSSLSVLQSSSGAQPIRATLRVEGGDSAGEAVIELKPIALRVSDSSTAEGWQVTAPSVKMALNEASGDGGLTTVTALINVIQHKNVA